MNANYQYENEIEAPASDETVDILITTTPAAPVCHHYRCFYTLIWTSRKH